MVVIKIRPLANASRGFTFIELIVATAIIMIMAAAALPLTMASIRRHKESEVRRELRELRTAIDKFKDLADIGGLSSTELRLGCENYPPSLQILVEGVARSNDPSGQKVKFLRRVPIDPLTGKADWGLRSFSDAPDSKVWGGQCVFDVYSKHPGKGLDGTPYRDW